MSHLCSLLEVSILRSLRIQYSSSCDSSSDLCFFAFDLLDELSSSVERSTAAAFTAALRCGLPELDTRGGGEGLLLTL